MGGWVVGGGRGLVQGEKFLPQVQKLHIRQEAPFGGEKAGGHSSLRTQVEDVVGNKTVKEFFSIRAAKAYFSQVA